MDWLRRNWPDLLIGLALVAVIAGIVATLLTGGSFFPGGGNGTGPIVSTPPAVDAPAGPNGAGASDGGLAGDPASQDPPSVAVPGERDAASGGLAAPDAGPPGAPDPTVGEEATDAPAAAADAPSPSSPGATPDAEADADAAPAAGNVQPLDPDESASSAADAPPAPDVPIAAEELGEVEAPEAAAAVPAAPSVQDPNAGLPTDPYRVSVGAFGDPANAQRQAEVFRDAGYPVFVGSQGALSIVLVGPYGDETRARAVAAEIRGGDYGIDPVIYRFEPDEDGASAVAANGTRVSATSDAGAGADAPIGAATADLGELDLGDAAAEAAAPSAPASAPEASASGDGTLLQVGAYVDAESATPQLERLEGLGFEARTLEESGLVKLVVGPFEGEALADARVVLDGADIPFFAR